MGGGCTKFHVYIIFRLVRGPDTEAHIRMKIKISSTACSPPVDFEKLTSQSRRYVEIHVTLQVFEARSAQSFPLGILDGGLIFSFSPSI